MDPDTALAEILDNVGTFWNPSTPKDTKLAIAEHIIEHAVALHEWMAKGGAPPKCWTEEGRNLLEVTIPMHQEPPPVRYKEQTD